TNIAYPEIPTAIGTVSKLAFDPAQLTSTAGPSLSVMSDGSTTSSYSPTSVSQVVASDNGRSSSSWGEGLLLIAGLALVVILPAYFLRGRGKRRKSLLTVQVPAAVRASKVAPSVQRFCSRCGGPAMPGTAYCASCGSPLVRN
ncbi:MAG: hypothetical protein OK455_08755, partial [Thaumarchaeota archaeon]|nr:hypothetical protein [Nitrososphaerota archaeon]